MSLQDDQADGWPLRLGRVAIIVGCMVLTTVALLGLALAAHYGADPPSLLYAYFQCLYILPQILLGLYAALYRSREPMVAFSLACALNTVLLLVCLLLRLYESPAESRQRRAGTCCGARSAREAGVDGLVRALLWFLGGLNLLLTLLSALVATRLAPAERSPAAQRAHAKSRSLAAWTLDSERVGEAAGARTKAPAASYVPQPVHLISQARQPIPQLLSVPTKSPAKASSSRPGGKQRENSAENTIESIRQANTRVE